MSKTERTKLPEVIAFAGPNGSGKRQKSRGTLCVVFTY